MLALEQAREDGPKARARYDTYHMELDSAGPLGTFAPRRTWLAETGCTPLENMSQETVGKVDKVKEAFAAPNTAKWLVLLVVRAFFFYVFPSRGWFRDLFSS